MLHDVSATSHYGGYLPRTPVADVAILPNEVNGHSGPTTLHGDREQQVYHSLGANLHQITTRR